MATAVPTQQKQLGAYYTPRGLADFLVDWAIRSPNDRVLDPACGDAVFIAAASSKLTRLGFANNPEFLMGFDIDAAAAASARSSAPQATIETADFFNIEPPDHTMRFDAVVGNPPYVRYHHFSGAARAIAQNRARTAGVELSGLSSSWAPFVIHAASFLTPGGRLAFVLPSELLLTDYAAPIRSFLERRFARVEIVTFEERIFPGALVDAVLLLAEGTGPGAVRVHRVRDESALAELARSSVAPAEGGKWSYALLPPFARRALGRVEGQFQPLGEIATVDIGIVTGANRFFLLSDQDAVRAGLRSGDLRPAIARARQMPEPVLSSETWDRQRLDGEVVWLFAPQEPSPGALTLIAHGESVGAHHSYKCRIREPWWRLRVRNPPDLLLSYMSNKVPQLVANEAGVVTTNLLHNVRLSSQSIPARWLALSWLNSATLLSCELDGRAYGGGVLKLETREAERVLVPHFGQERLEELEASRVNLSTLLRERRYDAAVDLVDGVVLRELSLRERRALREGWLNLRERRAARGKSAARLVA